MFLVALLASSFVFTAVLPEEVPDTTDWKVASRMSFVRSVAADIVRPGGLTLKYAQTRGICPEKLGADCTYHVDYELRTLSQEGKLVSMVQRYVTVGPTGARDEGVYHFVWKDRAPIFVIYFRKGDRWLREVEDTEEYETASEFFMVLMDRYTLLKSLERF